MPDVLILTGPPAAGKSTAALALAERYDRVAHIPVDALHRLITPTGRVHPWGEPIAWERQRRLLTRNACSLARNFLEERFAVIIEDVIITRDLLDDYVACLKDAGAPLHFVSLLPRLDVCLVRNSARDGEQQMPPRRVESLCRQFEAAANLGGSVIDSSGLTAYATADKLQQLTTSGASLIWTPAKA